MEKVTAEMVEEAAGVLRAAVPGFAPRVALVLGSGLGQLAASMEHLACVDYGKVPGMVPSTVSGHEGRFVLGRVGGVDVVCMQGRLHAYEGYSAQQIAFPIQIVHALGAQVLLVTNAAGGIDPSFQVGDLMLVDDHINFLGANPVVGSVDDPVLGPRFFDMTHAYSPRLRSLARQCAHALGIELREGVYLATLGPSFETPAEIRAFRAWGASAVGMSTVLEVIAARRVGMEVLGISLISNPAAGVCDQPLQMDDVLNAADIAAGRVAALVTALLAQV